MKNKIYAAIVIVSMIGLIAYVVSVDGLDNIIAIWKSTNQLWLLAGVLAMCCYWLLEGGILHRITKSYYPPQRFSQTIRTAMIGQLFDCLTPFASGGEPVQAYDMAKCGVPVGIATCSLLIKFIVYQIALTITSFAVLFLKFSYFSQINGFTYFVFAGFTLHFVVLAFLFCIGFFKSFAEKATKGTIRFLSKLHLMKNADQKLERALVEVDAFYEGFQQIKRNLRWFLFDILASILQIIVYSGITYLILRAFGNDGDVFTIISAQIFVALIATVVPTPSGVGGAEVTFFLFFKDFFSNHQVNMAMLLWRVYIFYLPIVVGTVFYLMRRKIHYVKTETGDVPKSV